MRPAALSILIAVAVTGCGGGSSSSTTTKSTPSTTTTGKTTVKHHKATKPLQQVRVAAPGSKLGSSANAKPGDIVQILVLVPPADASKRLNFTLDRTGPQTFIATSAVAGTSLRKTSHINESSAGAQISAVRYGCRLPPTTFCPVQVSESSSTHLKLSVSKPKVPVVLVVTIAKPGSLPAPRLLALGPPAPGSPVQASVLVTSVPQKKGAKPLPPSSSTTTAPGSVVNLRVALTPGAPARGTLRIAIPHTSGKSLSVEAGGTAQQPASTATINSSHGNIRVSGVVYGCALPPATFCPFSSLRTTATGLLFTLPTPRVPVTLTLLTDKA